MKPLFSAFICLLFLLPQNISAQDKSRHLGLWRGEDGGDIGYLAMDEAGFATFTVGRDTLGGRSFVVEEVEAYMRYEIDYGTVPHSIDFVVGDKESGAELGRLPGILRFEENKQLRICLNFDSPVRPTEFVEEDTIVFTQIGKPKDE